MVILWHCLSLTRFPPTGLGPLRFLASMGWTGVDLFFALSGFLITRLILEEEAEAGGSFNLSHFYARRALRILPPFYLVLGLNLVWTRLPVLEAAVGSRIGGPLEFVSLISYWSNYFFIGFPSVNPAPALLVYWSLCVEEHFYLLWPALLRSTGRRSARVTIGLALCALFLSLRLFGGERAGAVQTLSHFRMDSVLWGALGALAFDGLRRRSAWRRLTLALLAVLAVSLFATGFMSESPGRSQHAVSLTILAVFFTTLVVEVAASPRSRLTLSLEWAPLRSVGRVSYGMYLLHMQGIVLAAWITAKVAQTASMPVFLGLLVLGTSLTYVAARLMYDVYESRFLALRKRFRRRAALVESGRPTQGRSGTTP
jgi:peptidoglycan/LPS O-acetylase OafA/YrhL